MNKHFAIYLLVIASVVLLSANIALAEKNAYFQLSGYGMKYSDDSKINGATPTPLESEIGYGAGLAVGVRLTNFIRTEIEAVALSFKEEGATSRDGYVKTAMGNVIVDLPVAKGFTPYFGGGAGYAYLSDKLSKFSKPEASSAFAYQLLAGIDFNIDSKSTLVFGYKYLVPEKFEEVSGLTDKLSLRMHLVHAGLKFAF